MADLVIRVAGDITDFKAKMNDVVSTAEDAGNPLAAVAGIAAAAFVALVGVISESVAKYKETEDAIKNVTLAMQNQGIYSDSLAQNYRDQAVAISELTGIDKDSITQAQAKLQTLIGQRQITTQLTQAMVDLSTQTGSLSGAAEILGRAVDGNVRGLKQFNITVDEGLDRDDRLNQIVSKVSQQFGGMAENANTGLGSVKGLHTAMDDFLKVIGEKFAPLFVAAIQDLTDFFKWLTSNHEVIRLLSMSVGALGSAMETLHLKHKQAKTSVEELDEQISSISEKLEGYQNILKGGAMVRLVNPGAIAEAERLQTKLDQLIAQREKLAAHSESKPIATQDAGKKSNAQERFAKQKEMEKFSEMSQRDHLQAMRDQLNEHDAEVLKSDKEVSELESQLATETNDRKREVIKEQLARARADNMDAVMNEIDQQKTFNEEILNQDKYYQSLSLDEKQKFIEQNQALLVASIDNEKKARLKAAADEAKARITSHNQFLQDEIKFGTTYATINQGMHSEIYQGTKKAFSDMAEMQNSHNSTLKAIGKAAAIANITIHTAESALEIFAGFSTIPIIGPELGLAAAAAAIAYGAEQISTVTAAAQGGLLTGGIPGKDSIPVIGMPGELIVPTKNFDEVVSAVASQRNGTSEGGNVAIAVGFDGPEAQNVITIRQNQSKALGTYRGIG